jgi:ComF family protein
MCAACTEIVAVITPPWCERCGRPTEEAVAACPDCPPRGIALARSPFVYDGPLAAAIRGMKFSGWHGLARHLAAAMSEALGSVGADEITWVPLSSQRLARRGFDQAEVLARALSARLGISARRLLERRRSTQAQARMSGAERRRALAGAFRTVTSPPEQVLLVDDVLTTGSTAAACAEALAIAGARRVVLVTAARSIGGPVPVRCRPAEPRRDGRDMRGRRTI